MHSASYEITALIARYILFFLCFIVLIRSIFIARASRPNVMIYNNAQIASLTALGKNRTYYLGYDNIIGSSKRCDIQVATRGVAKIHIQIYKKKNNWMMCAYSRKPTYLNEIKVGGSIPISSNDIIGLGSQKFRFEIAEGGDS